ncbi:EF-hand calcium-binding domain-containing protein 5, partial [Apaloderma vittatum]
SYRLARMKVEAENKCKDREQVENITAQVKEMRKEALAIQFKEWTVDDSGRIPLAQVTGDDPVQNHVYGVPNGNCLLSKPICFHFLLAIYNTKLEDIDTLEKKVNIDEFTEYVHSYTEQFSDDMFQEILKHLCQCAGDFREAVRRDMWRQMFIGLFLDCDYGKVGLLDRQKILALLTDFYDRSAVSAKGGFCNPRHWPITELQEIELVDLWGGLDDQEVCEELSEKLVLSQTGISEEEILACEPVGDSRRGTSRMRTNVREGLFEQMGMSEAETGEISTAENQAAESSDAELRKKVAEVVNETLARKDSFSSEHGSQSGQRTSSETRVQDEDLLQDQGEGFQSVFLSQDGRSSQGPAVPLLQVLHVSRLARRKLLLEALFQKWDNNASGFLDLEEVDAILSTFKEGMEKEALRKDSHLDRGPSALRGSSMLSGHCDVLQNYVSCNMQCVVVMYHSHELDSNFKSHFSLDSFLQINLANFALDDVDSGQTEVLQVHLDLSGSLIHINIWALGALKYCMSNYEHVCVHACVERAAKEHLCSRYPQLSRTGKLSPKALQAFLELVASEFGGNEDEAIDNLVEFLTTSVERSHVESLQSLARRKWLHNIQQAAETSGVSMDPVYKAVFMALSQDAEVHGDKKKISAYIALLEKNHLSPERGQTLLRYAACTAEDAPYVLNQILYRDMEGISFAAVEEGKPIHVPRVQLHGNIHFWNYNRPVEERKGSLLVLPLQDARWRVFGILGLDTLRDQCEKTIFLTHEISFYQGVAHAFSKAYHHVCMLENVLQMTVTALDWLYPRAPSIHAVVMYLVEPSKDKTWDYALRKMITLDNTGQKEIQSSPVLLRKENLLRDYLFRCVDSSEVIHPSVRGQHHIAVPLRDLSGQAFGVFDISIGHHQKLPPPEHSDLQKMLKMAQAACSEILKMSLEETEPTYVLEAEHMAHSRHAAILFHRLMLQDLRECVWKLGAESFAEIKSYAEPPALVHNTVKAVLLLLHPDWKGSEKTENWSQCKLKLDDNLIQEIYCFDPTAASVQVQAELLLDCITGVPSPEERQHSSTSAQLLHLWVCTCLSLAEISRSLR